jgi:hypothetical protein
MLFLDSCASDVALCGSARQTFRRHNDNKIRRRDLFVEITSGVEQACITNDLVLQLVVICVTRRLNKESGRGPAIAYDNALLDEMSAGFPHILFDGSEVVSQLGLNLYYRGK